MHGTRHRAGAKSDSSNPLAASLSFQVFTGFFFCEVESDVDSVFFDTVFSNCRVFLITLLSKIKESIFKVSLPRGTATPLLGKQGVKRRMYR